MPDLKIKKTISNFKKELSAAEKAFNKEGSALEMRAAHGSGDIFGEDLGKQVVFNASLIDEGANITSKFHQRCEAIVLAIDETCRPLLSDQPSAEVVGELARFIQQVIDSMSQHNAEYSLSINKSDYGNVGTLKTNASAVSLSIRDFWMDHYRNMDGYDEDQKRLRKEKENEKRRAKRNEEDNEKDHEARLAAMRKSEQLKVKQSVPIQKKRDSLRQKADAFSNAVTEEKGKRIAAFLVEIRLQIEQEITEQKQKLDALGLFAFGEKSACKKRISLLTEWVKDPAKSEYAAPEIAALNKKTSDAIAQYRKEMDDYLKARFFEKMTIDVDISKTLNAKERVMYRISMYAAARKAVLYVMINAHEPLEIKECEKRAENIAKKLLDPYDKSPRAITWYEIDREISKLTVKEILRVRTDLPNCPYEIVNSDFPIKEYHYLLEDETAGSLPFPEPPLVEEVFDK